MSAGVNCPYCQTAVGEQETLVPCPDCGAAHHAECWTENGGCSLYGCRQTPPTEARGSMEIPVSWWGQEAKPCPACGRQILAAALRCRHCGATFASARPEDREEFRQRNQVASEHPGLRKGVVWHFVLSALPLTAPLGAIMSLVWYLPKRARIATLPALHAGLARVAMILGLVQTAAYLVLGAAFVVWGGSLSE